MRPKLLYAAAILLGLFTAVLQAQVPTPAEPLPAGTIISTHEVTVGGGVVTTQSQTLPAPQPYVNYPNGFCIGGRCYPPRQVTPNWAIGCRETRLSHAFRAIFPNAAPYNAPRPVPTHGAIR